MPMMSMPLFVWNERSSDATIALPTYSGSTEQSMISRFCDEIEPIGVVPSL